MSKTANFLVSVNGVPLGSALTSVLTGISVTLNAGGEADSASLSLDDADGMILMPQPGAPMSISLGWAGEGVREVFVGTVAEVKSSGSRSGGRTLAITASGFDATGGAKGQQRRSWDDKTVKDILTDAGNDAGITGVQIDPALASVVIDYWQMLDESFLAMGRRLAAEIGGQFRVRGKEAVMSKRAGRYTPTVVAAFGLNLHSWDISPMLSRERFGKVKAKWFDRATSSWKFVEVDTEVKSDAVLTLKESSATEAEARRRAEARAAAVKEASGGGRVKIEGDTGAIPDGLCVIAGARPGIDGAYRIKTVTHSYNRSGGFTSDLDLVQPQDGAGEDSR